VAIPPHTGSMHVSAKAALAPRGPWTAARMSLSWWKTGRCGPL